MKIFIAGHKGMVGSAIVRKLKSNKKFLSSSLICKDRDQLDLEDQHAVNDFFKQEKIDQVYLAAAMVGGIYANNSFPADFISKNLSIQNNVINSSFNSGVKKLLFLGSSCIYPKFATQPMKENELLSGKLEPTNEPYAIAKIAGIKMCESFNRQYGKEYGICYKCVMPTDLYGKNDNYDEKNSHVVPALISKFHYAKTNEKKEVVIWGTGTPKREFLYVDDMAEASIYVMNSDDNIFHKDGKIINTHINVGFGSDVTILELATIISEIVGFSGKIVMDPSKPDGTPRKLLDTTLLQSMGWQPKIKIVEGITATYMDFLKHHG